MSGKSFNLFLTRAFTNAFNCSGSVAGSPVLLHNLYSSGLSEPPNQHGGISLHSSPFGSRQPAIPIARTVTVARVASPLSINRAYQPLFLKSLKTYFELGRSLVKKGDIIAVAIDTADSNHLKDTNDGDGSSNLDGVDSR
jgi:peroxin-6